MEDDRWNAQDLHFLKKGVFWHGKKWRTILRDKKLSFPRVKSDNIMRHKFTDMLKMDDGLKVLLEGPKQDAIRLLMEDASKNNLDFDIINHSAEDGIGRFDGLDNFKTDELAVGNGNNKTAEGFSLTDNKIVEEVLSADGNYKNDKTAEVLSADGNNKNDKTAEVLNADGNNKNVTTEEGLVGGIGDANKRTENMMENLANVMMSKMLTVEFIEKLATPDYLDKLCDVMLQKMATVDPTKKSSPVEKLLDKLSDVMIQKMEDRKKTNSTNEPAFQSVNLCLIQHSGPADEAGQTRDLAAGQPLIPDGDDETSQTQHLDAGQP